MGDTPAHGSTHWRRPDGGRACQRLGGRSLSKVSTVLDALRGDRPPGRQRRSGLSDGTPLTSTRPAFCGQQQSRREQCGWIVCTSVLDGCWRRALECRSPLAWSPQPGLGIQGRTLDSMLGYRRERLRWLGTAGTRPMMHWFTPRRLVMVSLPLIARPCSGGRSFVQRKRRTPGPRPTPGGLKRSMPIAQACAWADSAHEMDREPVLAADNP